MPIFEIRFLSQFDIDEYDVFDTSLLDPSIDLRTVNLWDFILPVDVEKMKRYMKIQMNIRTVND